MSSVTAEKAKNVWLKSLSKDQRKLLAALRDQFSTRHNSAAIWSAIQEYFNLQKQHQILQDENQRLNHGLGKVTNNFAIFKRKVAQLGDLENEVQNLKKELVAQANEPQPTTEELNERTEI